MLYVCSNVYSNNAICGFNNQRADSHGMPNSIIIKFKCMVGSKYFQTAVLFNGYGLIAKSISVNEHLEQISLYLFGAK